MLAKTYACSSGGVHFSSRSRHCSPSARGARLPRGRLNRRIINIGVPSGGQARPASIQVARLSMLCLYGGNVSEPVVMQRSDLRRYPLPGDPEGMGLFPSACPVAWVRSLARCDTINWEDKFRLCARSPAKGEWRPAAKAAGRCRLGSEFLPIGIRCGGAWGTGSGDLCGCRRGKGLGQRVHHLVGR